jgi:DHA2 family multidrug resistance protein
MAGGDRPQIEVTHKGLLTVAVMAAMVMQVLDTTIANVALPHMQASLGATQDSVSWVLTSYIVASAIAIPLTGWLSDRIGTRPLFLLSVVIFVIASALCGLATSLPAMVAFRLLQGIGGAFLGPLAQSIMLDINRPSEHGKAMSIYGMGIMVGPITGPILGGWLTENFDWRWVFFVNLPVGLACLTGLWLLLPRVTTTRRSFDLVGWALIAITLGAFQLMLDRGQHVDWFNATEIWIEAGLAASALWMFCVHIATVRAPLFPLPMLRDRNLLVGSLFMFVLGMVPMAAMALLPPMLQSLFNYPVLDTGELLATRGIGVMVTMALAGRLIGIVDARVLVGVGLLIMASSLWMMTGWSLEMDWQPVVLSGIVQGVGLGFIFVPLNVLAFGTLPPQYRTDGASLFNLARNTGSSVGIAVVTVMLARNIQISHADLAAHVTPYNLALDPTLLRVAGSIGQGAMAAVDGMVSQQAAMIAYLDDFRLMMFATLAALPLLLLIRRARRGGDAVHVAME